jgi:hypothetical protein
MIRAERRWSSAKVIGALADVMVMKGVPQHIGPESELRGNRVTLTPHWYKTSGMPKSESPFVSVRERKTVGNWTMIGPRDFGNWTIEIRNHCKLFLNETTPGTSCFVDESLFDYRAYS